MLEHRQVLDIHRLLLRYLPNRARINAARKVERDIGKRLQSLLRCSVKYPRDVWHLLALLHYGEGLKTTIP